MACQVGLERSKDEKLLPAKFRAFCRELPVKFRQVFQEVSALCETAEFEFRSPKRLLTRFLRNGVGDGLEFVPQKSQDVPTTTE